MNHTKGEWMVDAESNGQLWILPSEDSIIPLAQICHASDDNQIYVTKKEEADAKLIAAAPEMLEALIEFKHYFETDFFRLLSEDGMTQSAWLTKMNKAIKKATS